MGRCRYAVVRHQADGVVDGIHKNADVLYHRDAVTSRGSCVQQLLDVQVCSPGVHLPLGDGDERFTAAVFRQTQLTQDQRQFVLDNGLTERHARAVLRLPENRRSEALIMIAKRKMNARATDLYIDQLLNETPGKHRVSMVKDVRIFVNTIDHAIRLMTDNGVPATSHREERDGYIEYTVRIPTAAAQK